MGFTPINTNRSPDARFIAESSEPPTVTNRDSSKNPTMTLGDQKMFTQRIDDLEIALNDSETAKRELEYENEILHGTRTDLQSKIHEYEFQTKALLDKNLFLKENSKSDLPILQLQQKTEEIHSLHLKITELTDKIDRISLKHISELETHTKNFSCSKKKIVILEMSIKQRDSE